MGLTKFGPNVLTLAGTNTYSGSTVVSAGTLVATNSSALSSATSSSTLTVNSGATLTLDVAGTGWAAADVSNLLSHNGGGFNAGSVLGIDTTNAGTGGFTDSAGSFATNMGLAKFGNNTLDPHRHGQLCGTDHH